MHGELERAGVSVAGIALRLEVEHESDVLADYRRRRHLSDVDAETYPIGVETGAIWVQEDASAAALQEAWRAVEREIPWTLLDNLEVELTAFFEREARESVRGSRWARCDPQRYSWDDDPLSPFMMGVLDVGAAAWATLRKQDQKRAAKLADPYAPANRTAYLDALEDDERDPEFARVSDKVRAEMLAAGCYDGSPSAVRRLINEALLRFEVRASRA